MNLSFQEDHISQLPALMLLEKLGYTYLTPDEALAMRGGKTSNVLLEEVLRNQLRRINSIRVNRNKEELFSEQNIENGSRSRISRTGCWPCAIFPWRAVT